jgi:aromatic ring-opening dioxygenase catalytic subunit (LigB family)
MLISRTLLVPSSPTLLIDERRGNSTPMLSALIEQAERLEADLPEAIVVVTSRWTSAAAFHVDDAKKHTSLIDMPGFGVEPRYDCRGEPALARAIVEEGRRAGLRAVAARRGVDSGVSVPLHFLAPARYATVVPVSISDVPLASHREWGACLRRAMTAWNGRAVLVVSGALTFHQHSFNLNREIAEDRDLDALALDALQSGAWPAIETRRAKFPSKAHPEVGWRHLEVLRGFLGEDLAGQVRAYEVLPGIGEALVEFEFGPKAATVAVAETHAAAGATAEIAAAATLPLGEEAATEAPPEPPAIAAAPPARAPKPFVRRTTGTWRARPPESLTPEAPGTPAARSPRPSSPRSSRPSSSRPSSSRPSSSRPSSPRTSRPSSPRPSRPGAPRTFGSSGPPRYPSSRPARSSSSGPPRSPGARPPRPASSGPPRYSGTRPPRPASSGPPRYSGTRPPRPSSSGPPRYSGTRPPRPSSSGPPRYSGSRPARPSSSSGPPRSSASRPPRGSAPRPPRPGAGRPPRSRPSS